MSSKASATGLRVPIESWQRMFVCILCMKSWQRLMMQWSTPNRETLVKMGQRKGVNKEFHKICVKHTSMIVMIDEIQFILLIIHGKISRFVDFLANFCMWILWKLVKPGNWESLLGMEVKMWNLFFTNKKQDSYSTNNKTFTY